jgi:hypothetical protein
VCVCVCLTLLPTISLTSLTHIKDSPTFPTFDVEFLKLQIKEFLSYYILLTLFSVNI